VLTVAALNVGNYRGMGARYVNALYRGCTRNLTVSHSFVCFTDDASGLLAEIEPRCVPVGLDGWYNKIALFRAEAFPSGTRVLYFDLDTVILGNIDRLAAYEGAFAALSDPGLPSIINSSIMAWEAGRYCDVWTRWAEESFPKVPGGDQEWIFDSGSGQNCKRFSPTSCGASRPNAGDAASRRRAHCTRNGAR
jgi:hypothetical protein